MTDYVGTTGSGLLDPGWRAGDSVRGLKRGRSLGGVLLAVALCAGSPATLAAQPAPSPGVPDYHIKWTVDLDGGGEWTVLDDGNGNTLTTSRHIVSQEVGVADVDVDSLDSPHWADPISITGTWDSVQIYTKTDNCSPGTAVLNTTFHDEFTISPAASEPRFFPISVATASDGTLYVRDPWQFLGWAIGRQALS